MITDTRRWLALDIGGANIKAAHSREQSRTLPFELWKRPDDLAPALTTAGFRTELRPAEADGVEAERQRLVPDRGLSVAARPSLTC